jgi:hypothetical protein
VSAEDTAPGFSILGSLCADGPYPDWRDALMVFGQFVGTWDLEVEYYDDTGQRTYQGRWEWSFAWILGGRAIQDVLIDRLALEPGGPSRPAGGTTLRSCDPGTGRWQVFYLGAASGITVLLAGGMAGDDIVLEGPDPDGTRNRWTFSDITPATFTWTGLESADGQEWRLNQTMLATRRPGT